MKKDFLKKLFPLSFKCQEKDTFIKTLVIYIVAAVAIAVAGALLGILPVVGRILGPIIGIIGYVVDVYATAGVVFAILVFVKVFK